MWSVPFGTSLQEEMAGMQWTHSRCHESDVHGYTGHVHTAIRRQPLSVNPIGWNLCTSRVVNHLLLNELTNWDINAG